MTIDIQQFHQTFFEESLEGLDTMENALLNLDVGAADEDTVNTIFRAAHSIKGGSATFGFSAIASFTHVMETLLDEVRDGKRKVDKQIVELFLQSVDCLRAMLGSVMDGSDVDEVRVASVQQQLEDMLAAGDAPVEEETSASDDEAGGGAGKGWLIDFTPHPDILKTGNDPLRLFRELEDLGELEVSVDTGHLPPFAELDAEECHLRWQLRLLADVSEGQVREVFEWVEDECELGVTPLAAVETASEETAAVSEQDAVSTPPERVAEATPKVTETAAAARTPADKAAAKTKPGAAEASIRVSIDKVDAIINQVGELVITQSMLGQLGEHWDETSAFDTSRLEKLRDGLGELERNTRELQESVMRMRMLPISFVFNRFPRLVRDLSNQLGKQVELEMSGESTELDKTVMEKIGDPLVHLVRNALDHGVEGPEARRAAGKPETGTVRLNAYHKGGHIIIEISDDGNGLDRDRVYRKALERGLVGDDETLSDEQVYDLIFQPGFSTAEVVSDVSGRGVGMDVVRRNINELNGSVEVNSAAGKGTTFTVRLPLTLAIVDGQLVMVGDQTFVIPLVSIIESLQMRDELVKGIAGKADVYRLREDYIPIVRMSEIFNITPADHEYAGQLMVVVEGEGQKVGLVVDDLLAQQQVVVKSLEPNFQRVDGLAGATILGDGTVALILDTAGLIKTYSNGGGHGPAPMIDGLGDQAA